MDSLSRSEHSKAKVCMVGSSQDDAAGTTDALTGAKTRIQFEAAIGTALHDRPPKRFTESYLCCDIEHLGARLDTHGHHAGDAAIIEVANRLKQYGRELYWVGGDEFVIVGIDSSVPDINNGLSIQIRQCVLEVDLPVSIDRSQRVKSWLLAHVQMALVQPAILNNNMRCSEPPEWDA